MDKVLCWKCRCLRGYTISTQKANCEINGKNHEYDEKYAICDECREEITVPGLNDENIRALETVYEDSVELRGSNND